MVYHHIHDSYSDKDGVHLLLQSLFDFYGIAFIFCNIVWTPVSLKIILGNDFFGWLGLSTNRDFSSNNFANPKKFG